MGSDLRSVAWAGPVCWLLADLYDGAAALLYCCVRAASGARAVCCGLGDGAYESGAGGLRGTLRNLDRLLYRCGGTGCETDARAGSVCSAGKVPAIQALVSVVLGTASVHTGPEGFAACCGWQ